MPYSLSSSKIDARRPWRALGGVRGRDFDTPDYQFVTSSLDSDALVLEGQVREIQLQPGFWMHCAEVSDLHNMVSRVPLEAGLRVVVVLDGELDVQFDGHPLQLKASQGIKAALIHMPHQAMFERRWQLGKWERKLSLHLTPEWLQAHGWVTTPGATRLVARASETSVPSPSELRLPTEMEIHPWQPSSHALALAEQLLSQPDPVMPGLSRIRLASRALDLLFEALSSTYRGPTQTPASRPLRPRDQERLKRLRSFLDEEVLLPYQEALPVIELGRRFGLSSSALQRQFRQAFGYSVNEYRRQMRLRQARTNLEQGMAVTEAAYQAGYSSAANFATAFKREFGLTPRGVRPIL